MNTGIDKCLNKFCYKIGQDPLLVQGAGGNVSIKNDGILLVKASGTSLSQALDKNIFVEVDLDYMNMKFGKGNFSFTPNAIGESNLRPSIETMLHAIMKHKVVVHLHMISALTHLVKIGSEDHLSKIIGDDFNWAYVSYTKPGENLAMAVSEILDKKPKTDVIFLENHGIVIGSDSIASAEELLRKLDVKLGRDSICNKQIYSNIPKSINTQLKDFKLCNENKLHNLVLNRDLFYILSNYWALFPDHVVFLGNKPLIVNQLNQLDDLEESILNSHCFIFIKNIGVLQHVNATDAQKEQLSCYYDVISNIDPNQKLKTLSKNEIGELLNWDAEIYRQELSKNKQLQ